MPPGEHIHIITAGEKIHTAYPATIRSLPTITRTYVLADSIIYEISRDPEVEKGRLAVRKAVSATKEISVSLSIPFSREMIFPPVYESVRDTLTKISRENPGTQFTFDLSGGIEGALHGRPLLRAVAGCECLRHVRREDGEKRSAPGPPGSYHAGEPELPDDPRHPPQEEPKGSR